MSFDPAQPAAHSALDSQHAAAPMNDNPEPDSFEKRLRFGCGFVLGAVVAFFVIARVATVFTDTSWAVIAGVAVVFGFLAMRYGDAFWRGVSEWFR